MYGDIDSHIMEMTTVRANEDDIIKEICQKAGGRPSGGSGMEIARGIVKRRLHGMGAENIAEEEVKVTLWTPGKPEVVIRGNGSLALSCIHCIGSAAGRAESRLFDAGVGEKEYIESSKDKIEGCIALLCGHVARPGRFTPLAVRLRYLHQAGAAAVILVTQNGFGLPAAEIASNREPVQIPVVSVSREDGEKLRAIAADRKKTVYVYTDGYGAEAMCANLVADICPLGPSDGTIILGAHLDSFCDVQGAFDNLTGVSAVLRIASLLAPFRDRFRRKLRLVFYTGEELGMLGSRSYVARHMDELSDIRLVVNMDSLFDATARGTAVMFSPEYRDTIERLFRDAGTQVLVRDLFCMSSDYFPFMMEGIPAMRPADLENRFPDWSHSVRDDPENVDEGWVPLNSQVYAKLIIRLLCEETLPRTERMTKKEISSRLIIEDVTETIRSMGFDF